MYDYIEIVLFVESIHCSGSLLPERMLKCTSSLGFLKTIFSISKPPVSGYEITELPNERILRQFMQYYKSKGVLVVFHSGLEAVHSKASSSLNVSSPKSALSSSECDSSPSGAPVVSLKSPVSSSFTSSSSKIINSSQHTSEAFFSRVKPTVRESSSTSGASPTTSADPLLRTFVSSMNTMNFGHPDELKIALVPGKRAPTFVRDYQIITYPTTVLFCDGQFVDRCTGARTHELAIKSLFMLRNRGRNIFSREE